MDNLESYQKLSQYWINKFAGYLVNSSLPTDFERNNNMDYETRTLRFTVGSELYSKLLKLSKNLDTLLFTILMAGLKICLYKYTKNQDITIGTTIHRQNEGVKTENKILAIRDEIDVDLTIASFLKIVKQSISEAYEYHNYPYKKLVSDLRAKIEDNRTPLFDITILLENINNPKIIQTLPNDITFIFKKKEDHIVGTIEYRDNLYKKETITNFLTDYLKILLLICDNPKEKILRLIDTADNSSISLKKVLENIVELNISKKKQNHFFFNEEFEEKSIKDLTIKPAEKREYYQASSAQQRMYLLEQLNNVGTAYNVFIPTIIEGDLDVQRFKKAFRQIVKIHQAFSTSFELIDGELMQRVNDDIDFELEYIEECEIDILEMANDFVKPFDLSRAPLMRATLIKDGEKHYLFLDIHHIITDSISQKVFIDHLGKLYAGIEVEPSKIQYTDFSEWQKEFYSTDEFKEQEKYWLSQFTGEIPVLNFPTDFPRPATLSFEGDLYEIILDKTLAKKLRELTVSEGATLFMTLLAAFYVFLNKFTDAEDIIVGTPISGRHHLELENIIGLFVNTLALRNYPTGKKTFLSFFREVIDNSLTAYQYQDYQFEMLVEKLDLKQDMSRNLLFDVMFSLQNKGENQINFENLKITSMPYRYNIAKFDLSIDVIENVEEIRVVFEYRTSLFKRDTIARMSDWYVNILREVTKSPEVKIRDIDILSTEEKHKLLFDFNSNYTGYHEEKTFTQLFEEQVAKTPEDIAVVSKKRQLTYAELNSKANALAGLLKSSGVKQETIVGIMTERSEEMVIGVLAILKAGGAYLPIDPEYPEERINFMLEDSGAVFLLTQKALLKTRDYQCQLIYFDSVQDDGNIPNLPMINTPENLAYIVYTSGSTGKPKGVMIQHNHFVNVAMGWRKEYFLDQIEVNLLQLASFSFDVFAGDLAKSLTNGGKMVICPADLRVDYPELYTFVRKHWITMFDSTPSLIIPFMEYVYDNHLPVDNLQLIIFGADACRVENYRKLLQRYGDQIRIINGYGVTEATVESSYYEETVENLPISGNVPIGKPLPNTRMYVLGKDMELKPIGVYGELYIGGDSVARGYLNRPELNAERFIPNPYVPDELLYKTGDIVRWMADGNVEFAGRGDFQVKIRGFRVEMGEIENCLLSHPKIKEAAVLDLIDESGMKYLCGYVVTLEDISMLELKSYLAEQLPEYMIPVRIVKLEKMPLSVNGKIDRKALPEPVGTDGIESGIEYVAPTTETEARLVNLWEEVLSVQRVGIKDNFFALGGHSIKAMQLVSKIFKEFNVKIALTEFFDKPTIKELAGSIKQKERDVYYQIEKVPEREYYPGSSAQKRLFILHQFAPRSINYNMPGIVMISGSFEIERFKQAFITLIQRHESLRTTFEFKNGELFQRINDGTEFKIQLSKASREELDGIIEKFIQPFDLQKGPLIRIGLVETEDKYLLMFDVHHIIADGISMEILTNELMSLYNGQELPELPIQYKDFTVWQNEFFNTEQMKKQEDYWLNQFAGEIPVLSLHTDFPRPPVKTFEGDLVYFALKGKEVKELVKFTRDQGVTLNMFILAIFNIVLARWSGQEDIIIGTPISGRSHPDLERIIGMFVNTLALRNYPERDKIFSEFIQEVQKKALLAYENQDYQFEMLIEKLDLARDMSRNPIFDVMFVMQELETTHTHNSELIFTPYEFGNKTAKFDFTLYASRVQDGIDFAIEYSTTLFRTERMQLLGEHLINTIYEVLDNPTIQIKGIQMISEEEKENLLNQLNNTQTDYPEDKTIHQLFKEQVMRTPTNIALTYENQSMTYSELDEYSDRLAWILRSHGVKDETLVGLMLERSLEMVIGIIAIVKSGGAYLPLDPDYPRERLEYMLIDSETSVLISKAKHIESLNYSGEVIDIAEIRKPQNRKLLDNVNHPTDLLYIIYTSGSTGRPKGVMIEHKNVVRLMFNEKFQFDFTELDVWTLFHSICFDFSVWEMYGALLYGGRLVIVPKLVTPDPFAYLKLISKEGVTVVNQTPTAFYSLSDRLMVEPDIELKVRYVIFGGEALKPAKLRDWKARYPRTRLINMYGITETTVHVTFKEITEKEIEANISNIGKPIPTLSTYIMDRDLNLLPQGTAGELCVGGEGVARGYLKRPELTEEKFILNPYRVEERLYRSGDLVVMLPDGELKYLGRIDRQVKIRGFRIELGEIERQLLRHPEIEDVVIVDRENEPGDKYLCAYIVTEKELSVTDLRNYLAAVLPEYMIPAYFIKLASLPLTANGKVDRRALPLMEGRVNIGIDYVPPTDEVEKKLVSLYSRILGVERVGMADDFFALGGHSMKATQLVAAVFQEFQVELPLQEVFKTPTVGELALYIKNAGPMLETYKEDGLVLLKKGTGEATNFFLIHDGSGGVEGYVEFCNALTNDFHYRGIKVDRILKYGPANIQIKDIAQKYIQLLKQIQPQGPYYLAGWSIGGTIAFEIAIQLEQMGDAIEFFAMFDTYPPLKTDRKEFTLAEEIELAKHYLPEEVSNELDALTTIEGVWEFFVKYIEESNLDITMIKESLSPNMLQIIPDFALEDIRELVYYVNLIRSFELARDLYIPERVLQTEVNFFKASESIEGEEETWNSYCSNTFKVYSITGDHYSIFKIPAVYELAKCFQNVMIK